jgi:hypothetical protein
MKVPLFIFEITLYYNKLIIELRCLPGLETSGPLHHAVYPGHLQPQLRVEVHDVRRQQVAEPVPAGQGVTSEDSYLQIFSRL